MFVHAPFQLLSNLPSPRSNLHLLLPFELGLSKPETTELKAPSLALDFNFLIALNLDPCLDDFQEDAYEIVDWIQGYPPYAFASK